MVEIEFDYEQKKIIIQTNLNEKFEDAIKKLENKIGKNGEDLSFLFNGKVLRPKEIIKNIMGKKEKKEKKMKILVNNLFEEKDRYIKPKDIICPKCQEICKYKIIGYKIKLYDCENGHINENIALDEFLNTQNIDQTKIKCGICKIAKKVMFTEFFYKCYECKTNMCPNCKDKHDKTHSIIKYDEKYYKCNKHTKEKFVKYCEDCKKDICLSCINEHKTHKSIGYEEKIIDLKEVREKIDNLKIMINKFKDNIKITIDKLIKIGEYLDKFCNINYTIIDNYENNKDNRNYLSLLNLNYIKQSIDDEINTIKHKYNYGFNINKLLYIYDDILNNNEEIEICYKPKEYNERKVRIFGNIFVNNNIEKCIIIYKDKEYDLKEYFNDIEKEYNYKDSFLIKLRGINKITDMSHMFSGCNTLISISGLSKLNTSNISDMAYMFYNCSSLLALPDISNWNTSYVKNLSYMFSGCSNLSSLSDISNWETFSTTDLSYMFRGCINLVSLPKISNWKVDNIINMSYLFNGCRKLQSLPDISHWNMSNTKKMNGMFMECNSLISLPDISHWNISNVNNISYMFYYCNSLSSLPNISVWDTSNIVDMSYLFSGCNKLSYLPDISKWCTKNVKNISAMFIECILLQSIPDISKWNVSNVTNMNFMFNNCTKLQSLPDISKWDISNVENLNSIFSGCSSLFSLPDISKWNTSKLIDINDMFIGCNKSLNIPLKFQK